jgi:predicted anti-sigma-YlaC factor YlaD
VPTQPNIVELDCGEVRRELGNYTEGDLTAELRSRIEKHLRSCRHCTAVYYGVHNVVQLIGDGRVITVPKGFSQRLRKRLLAELR